MWLETVKKRMRVKNVENLAELLDTSEIIKDFYLLIKKSKPLVPPGQMDDFMLILRILTEEAWKEQKKFIITKTDVKTQEKTNIDDFGRTENSINEKKSSVNRSVNYADSITSPNSRAKDSSFTRFIDSSIPKSFTKCKLPVSSEISYMVFGM